MEQKNPLSADEAQELALTYWSLGQIAPTTHFERRAIERNVDAGDVQFLLEGGKIRKKPEYNQDHDQWNYMIEGVDLDGTPLAVVFALDENDRELILITTRDV